jgi:hypothetical protein
MTEPAIAGRIYAMAMMEPGDWVFPSNDRETMWRVTRYDDPEFDGQRQGWQVHRIPFADLQAMLDKAWETPLDWSHWEYFAGGFRTKKEAADYAARVIV